MHRLLLILFGVTLALAPVPLASNRDWSWSPLAVVTGLLLAGVVVALVRDPELFRRALANFRTLLVPGVLTALVLLWAVVQMTAWTPEGWASSLSSVAVLGPDATVRSIDFNRELAVTGLMRLLTNIGFFLLGALLAGRASDARGLLATIVIAASVYTLYAMVAQAANRAAPWTGVSIWTPFEPFFTGTFINANNYATYAGVAAIAALTLALRPRRSLTPETTRQLWRRRLSMLSGMGGFWIASALVLVAGVVFSASRAGSASFVLAGMTMAALYTRGMARVGWLIFAPLVLLVMIVTLPGGQSLAERAVRLLTEGEGGRQILFGTTIDAISLRDRPPRCGPGITLVEAVV